MGQRCVTDGRTHTMKQMLDLRQFHRRSQNYCLFRLDTYLFGFLDPKNIYFDTKFAMKATA